MSDIEKEKEDFGVDELDLGPREVFYERFAHKTNTDENDPANASYEYIWHKALEMSLEEALEILTYAVDYHKGDPNFPDDLNARIKETLAKGELSAPTPELYSYNARGDAAMIRYWSAYLEVRSVTDPFDDVEIPVETFRAYFIGFVWAIVGCGVNSFFDPRQPSITLGTGVLQIVTAISGKVFQYVIPNWGFTVRGERFSLNPGKWTLKEQMLASIIISSANGATYAFWNIIVQNSPVYYGNTWATFGYQILLVLSTQMTGFGLAGIMRRLVVYPVRAMWPTLLPAIALNKAVLATDANESVHGWKLSRFKFFGIFFAGGFAYYWLPGFLMQFLSYFDWMCWIAPNNVNVNSITGIYGMGINPIPTFDWNIISFNLPLSYPFYTQVNNFAGALLAGAVLIPAVWYTNYRWTGFLPINSNQLFDNTAQPYQVQAVLDENGLFSNEQYQEYSPPYYSAANLVVYGAFFALYPYAVVETFLLNWAQLKAAGIDVWRGIKDLRRSNFADQHDAFSDLLSKYKEVPDWWFLVLLVISVVFGIVCVEVYPTNTPVWTIFFAIGINAVFLIPITIIYSTTGFSFGLNVLVELIAGYALPGNGVGLMIVKAYGYNIDGQAQNYITDQKISHYTKVPPRAIFKGQVIAAILQCFVSVGIANWLLSNVDGLCTLDQRTKEKFTCPNENTYYSASVIWGVIGPKLVFHSLYPILKYCFLIGALLPFPIVYLKRKFPKYLTSFQAPVFIGGLLTYAPYSIAFVTPSLYMSVAMMYYVRRRYYAWWAKYNYVLGSALDASVAFGAIIIFFAVEFNPVNFDWWGVDGMYDNIDQEGGVGRITLAVNQTFGFPKGQFPSH